MADEGDSESILDIKNIQKLKVQDLRKALKDRGLPSTGNKNELVERLKQSLQVKSDITSNDSVDELIDDEYVLNEDELEEDGHDYKSLDLDISELSTVESMILDDKKNIEKRKVNLKRKSSSDVDANIDLTKPAKKIVLNRNSSVSSTNEVTAAITDSVSNGQTTEKKVVKLSELSMKERLEMRAKKFGTPLSTDAKKAARAQRFGQQTAVGNKINVSISSAPNASLDVLKKRAERFGTVSSVLESAERQDQLLKRQERFGQSSPQNGTVKIKPK